MPVIDADYWRRRWRDGETGWHRDEVMPLLVAHWPALGVAPGTRVLVPLCGKSLDMAWLAAQGHRVLGIDVSELALEAFAREHAGDAAIARVELRCADVFAVDDASYAGCGAAYDRAALIALPPAMRTRYAREVYGRLPAGGIALMITLEYPQACKEGPPFAVKEAEVRALFELAWEVRLLERRDILASQPAFVAAGVPSLHTAVYRLRKRA